MQKRESVVVYFYCFCYLTGNIGGTINIDINFFSNLKHFD